jgi:hypothetical protein
MQEETPSADVDCAIMIFAGICSAASGTIPRTPHSDARPPVMLFDRHEPPADGWR